MALALPGGRRSSLRLPLRLRLRRSARPSGPRKPLTKRQKRRRRARRVVQVALVLVLAVVLGLATFIRGLLAAPIDLAVAPPPTSALLLADDGRQIASIPPPERREIVSAKDIPEVMKQAIVSAEDERFYDHKGVDPLATTRAIFRDLTGGNTQGGSTLTQQYVKNAYVGNERTALRKIKEAALAVRLEDKLSKDQIITDYLNALYLGNGLYGVQAASRYYFGVPITQLGGPKKDPLLALARASMLAGIAPAPTAWNPVADLTIARKRQQYTLRRMEVGNYVDPKTASKAYELFDTFKPVRLTPPVQPGCLEADPAAVAAGTTPSVSCTQAAEFTDYVTQQLDRKYASDPDVLFRGGLRVKTTVDLDLQTAFNQALLQVLPDKTDPQAAIVAVDYTNGDVKAMGALRRAPALLDSKDKVLRPAVQGYQRKLGFNLATLALRSTGSTIKPFTYATALASGDYTPYSTRFGPGAYPIDNPGGTPNPYVVHNSEPSEAGTFTLRRALANSVNTVYVPLAIKVGRNNVAKLAVKAGLPKSVLKDTGSLSFGIGGGVEVTPLSEALAYSTFANNGTSVGLRSYTEVRTGGTGTYAGTVVSKTPSSARVHVITPTVAGEVVDALKDVVSYGTAARDVFPIPTFGKTGTTNDSTDAWFTGCVPELKMCIASWMGNEYQNCSPTLTVGSGKAARKVDAHVDGPCGGMHDLHGVNGQIFGGTLPARIFTTALADYQAIKAKRAAAAKNAGIAAPLVTPTPTPVPTRSYYNRPRPTYVPRPTAPVATATASPAPRRTTTPAPQPTQTTAPAPLPPVGGSPSP